MMYKTQTRFPNLVYALDLALGYEKRIFFKSTSQ